MSENSSETPIPPHALKEVIRVKSGKLRGEGSTPTIPDKLKEALVKGAPNGLGEKH